MGRRRGKVRRNGRVSVTLKQIHVKTKLSNFAEHVGSLKDIHRWHTYFTARVHHLQTLQYP